MKLLLFDIDGTLLHPGPKPRQWLNESLNKIAHANHTILLEDVMGSTDPFIIESALQKIGIPDNEIAAMIPAILEHYVLKMEEAYSQDPQPKLLYPGVIKLLKTLYDNPSVMLGLITGNLEQTAKIKLTHFGIWDYFSVGAYASDASMRSMLPPIARLKANKINGKIIEVHHTVIIGDTLKDLEAARVNQMLGVLVRHNRDEDYATKLKNAHPDLYLSDFQDPEPFIHWLNTLE